MTRLYRTWVQQQVNGPSASSLVNAHQTLPSQQEKEISVWGPNQITCNSKFPSILLPTMLLLSEPIFQLVQTILAAPRTVPGRLQALSKYGRLHE